MICYAPGGEFCLYGLGLLVLLERKVTVHQYTVILSDHLYHMMMHFSLNGIGLFQDVNASIRWV